jgi:hypothetical protein
MDPAAEGSDVAPVGERSVDEQDGATGDGACGVRRIPSAEEDAEIAFFRLSDGRDPCDLSLHA